MTIAIGKSSSSIYCPTSLKTATPGSLSAPAWLCGLVEEYLVWELLSKRPGQLI
jgi:hypothetical protein